MKSDKESLFKQLKQMNTSGFTLVEVIVTLVILTILLTGAVMGIASWNRNSIYKKNNEYAQTLFIAAQAALAQEAAAGNTQELLAYVENGGAGSGLVQDYDASRTLYYLDIRADEKDNLEGNRLYQLLCNYVYDQKIFEAAIRLEFDPGEGAVYSLSYSDRVTSFNYSEDDGSDGVTMGINSRIREDEGLRKKQLLGYYDTVLSEQAPLESYGKPSFQKASLDNEEMLVLRLKLSPKYERFMLKYNYGFEVYDAAHKKRLSFYIKGSDLGDNDNNTATTHTAMVKVAKFNENGEEEIPKEYPLQITVNQSKEICIVLDAVDLQASEILDEKYANTVEGKESYQTLLDSGFYVNTTGILRFMGADDTSYGIPFDTESIYVQARAGVDLHDANIKTTNTGQNPFMGKKKENANKDITYEIQNARHLYNMRYTEIFHGLAGSPGSGEQTKVSYSQTADIGWGGTDGLVGHYQLYDTSRPQGEWQVNPEAPYSTQLSNADGMPFPSTPVLHKNSSYSAGKGILPGNHQIRGLTLYEEKTAKISDYKQVKNYALGLFRWNEGQISNVDFYDVKVEGQNYVGTVCGVNLGSISRIGVKRSEETAAMTQDELAEASYVKGLQFVGGITGGDLFLLDTDKVDETYLTTDGRGQQLKGYIQLHNEVPVTGNSYVGGIIGASCFGNDKLTADGSVIQECTNKGSVTGYLGKKKMSVYLGGIVGYSYGASLRNCESTLGNKDFYAMETSDFAGEDDFVGDYMGGIVGYGTAGSTLENCATKGGTLKGHKYVGGIAGYLEYDASMGNMILDGKGAENKTDIIAYEYAGGILGANASLDNSREPLENYEEARIVQNWTNKGIVVSFVGYAGGITGFNTGKLVDCTSTKDLTDVAGETQIAAIRNWINYDTEGCTGGLAGYNNGFVKAVSGKTNGDIVVGTNYVGGLVGYNDVDGVLDLTKYNMKGGYVDGDAFVGGLIGCNVSDSIFSGTEEASADKLLQAEPDCISGLWYVGGLIGGNLAAMDNAEGRDWYLQCRTGNQMGKVTAAYNGNSKIVGGIAGGYIGYNRILYVPGDSAMQRKSIRKEADFLAAIAGTYVKDLTGAVKAVLQWEKDTGNLSGAGKLYLVDTTGDAGETTANTGKGTHSNGVGEVSGGVMIGGIIGYNARDSRLELRGLVNRASVYSEGNISSTDFTSLNSRNAAGLTQAVLAYDEKGTPYVRSDGDPVNYSYTGGIIGMAQNKVTIDNCINEGTVTTQALGTTYYGNLTEVNAGTVIRCQAKLSDTSQGLYAGGITGKNTAEGKIMDCTVSGTVTGNRMAGGLAAENFGQISTSTGEHPFSLTMKGSVRTENGCTGGIAGFNAGTVSGANADVEISGNAYRAGGIAGVNRGSIDAGEAEGKILISSGSGAAGGISGENQGNITNCTFSGNVQAAGTDFTGAGGIVGLVSGESVIMGCENNGIITGDHNTAGIIGIVDQTDGRITIQVENCVNHGTVSGKHAAGVAGRISGIANGTLLIRNCVNTADLDGNASVTGGIIGVLDGKANGGEISVNDCRNYGKPINQNDIMHGILGETAEEEQGTFEADKYLKISECINVSDLKNPVASDSLRPAAFDNNYYFTQPASFDGNTMAVTLYPDPGTTADNAANIADNDNRTRGVLKKSADASVKLTFKDKDGKDTAINTEYLRISWFREQDSERTVQFTLTVAYEGGETVDLKPADGSDFWKGKAGGNKDAGASLEDCEMVSLKDSQGWRNEKVESITIHLNGYEEAAFHDLDYYSIWDIYVDNTQTPPEEAQKRGIAEPLYVKKNPNADSWNAYRKSRFDNVPFIRDMSENPCTWSEAGKELYLRIDDQLHWKNRVREKLNPPQGLQVKLENSEYHISWDSMDEAYGYEVKAVLYTEMKESSKVEGKGSSAYIPTGTNTVITPSMDWAGLYLRISVRAKSIFGEEYDSDEVYYADENNNTYIKVQPMLPAPEIYLEKQDSAADTWFLHLENAQAYKAGTGFAGCRLVITLQTGDIGEEKASFSSKDFQVKNGEVVMEIKDIQFGGEEKSQIGFQMFPEEESKYLKSPVVTMEQWMLTGEYLKDQVAEISLDRGTPYLTGTSPDTLGYDTLFKSLAEGRSTLYRTELVMFDPQLGAEVAAGSSDTVSGRAREEITSGSISDVNLLLAEYQAEGLYSEMDNIKVRTYAYASGNTLTGTDGNLSETAACYLGSRKPLNEQPLTAKQLVSNGTYLTKDGTFTLMDRSGNAKNKNKYKVNSGYVIERAGAQSDGEPLYNVYTRFYLKDPAASSKQYAEQTIKLNDLKQPAPVISEEYEQNGDTTTFRWDGRQRDGGAGYQVKLMGIREDNSEVCLESLKETEQTSLTITGSGWEDNYKTVRLEVTRLGIQKEITDSFGGTRQVVDKLYSKSVREYYRKLPVITWGTVQLTSQDELNYDIYWNRILDEPQRSYLKEYRLYAQVSCGAEEEKEVQELEEKLKKAYGDTSVETLNDASGKLTGYKVSLSVRKKAIEPYDPSYDKNYSENKEENFSLEPFSGWEVELYVNAIATDGNEVYRDSAEGRHYRIKIPERLELPADIKTDLTDKNGGKITDGSKYPEDAFDKLSMEYVLQGSELSGEYKLEAAVYAKSYEGKDFIDEDGDIDSDFLDESGVITAQPLAPNTDQLCVVVSPASSGTVAFALNKDNLTGWSTELAGKYLVLRYRATQEESISSVWSDYQIVQLPKVKPDVVSLVREDTEEKIGMHSAYRETFLWDWKYEEGTCLIEIKDLSGNSHKVSIDFAEGKVPVVKVGNTEIIMQKQQDNIYEGNLDSISFDAAWPWENTALKHSARLRIVNDEKDGVNIFRCSLILPDISKVYGTKEGEEFQYLFTSAISVQQTFGADSARVNSDTVFFVRTGEQDKPESLSWEKGETDKTLDEILGSWDSGELGGKPIFTVQDGKVPVILRKDDTTTAFVNGKNTLSGNSLPAKEKTDSVSDNSIETETGMEEEQESESHTSTGTAPEKETETGTETDTGTETGTETEASTESHTAPESESESQNRTEYESQTESQSYTEPESHTESRSHTEPEGRMEYNHQTEPRGEEPKPQIYAQTAALPGSYAGNGTRPADGIKKEEPGHVG